MCPVWEQCTSCTCRSLCEMSIKQCKQLPKTPWCVCYLIFMNAIQYLVSDQLLKYFICCSKCSYIKRSIKREICCIKIWVPILIFMSELFRNCLLISTGGGVITENISLLSPS